MPEISIIIPVYCVEAYLASSLESLLTQTTDDFEIILVDDGSPDKSGEICDSYAVRDKRIRVVHQSNQGAGHARNVGIELARGKYISFVDADDSAKPNMLERAKEAIESGPYDFLMFGNEAVRYNEDESAIKETQIWSPASAVYQTREECRSAFCDMLFSTSFNTPWNKLYRRDIILEHNIRFPQLRRAQDAVFNMEYYKHINSFCVIEDVLYTFRLNTDAKVWKKFPKDLYLIDEYYDKFLVDMLREFGRYDGSDRERIDTLCVNSAFRTIGFYRNPLWELTKTEADEYIYTIISRPYLKERLTDLSLNSQDMIEKKLLLQNMDIKGIKKRLRRDTFINNVYESALYKKLSKLKHSLKKS